MMHGRKAGYRAFIIAILASLAMGGALCGTAAQEFYANKTLTLPDWVKLGCRTLTMTAPPVAFWP